MTACGLLGPKKDAASRVRAGAGAGCLDALGPQVEAFVAGDLSPAEWDATTGCLVDQLTMFKRYVRPSQADGYSPRDITAFVTSTLVTQGAVTPALIQATFELKRSLLGGSASRVTARELELVLAAIHTGRRLTTPLLPLLKERRLRPNPAGLLKLAEALRELTRGLLADLGPHFSAPLERGSLETLLAELKKLHGWDLKPEYVDLVLEAKSLLAGGGSTKIEGAEWGTLLQALGDMGSAYLGFSSADPALISGPNAMGEFVLNLTRPVREVLRRGATANGGMLPLATLAAMIQKVPASFLTAAQASAIVGFLSPLSQKILASHAAGGIDTGALDVLFDHIDFWGRGQTHLEAAFDRSGLDTNGDSKERVIQALEDYSNTVDPSAQPEVRRLIMIANRYSPLFMGQDPEITWIPNKRFSLSDLSRYHLIRIVVERLLKTYSSLSMKDKGLVEDLKILVSDITPLGASFYILDPTIPNIHARRFQEANFFTLASNGDQYLDLDESVYLVAYYLSLTSLTERIVKLTQPLCGGDEKDAYQVRWMEVGCFRKVFFSHLDSIWDRIPGLLNLYKGLSASDRTDIEQAIEKGARRYGYSLAPVGRYDVESMAGIFHYMESLFRRFDENLDQRFSTQETLNAFPIFRNILAEVGGIPPTNTGLLEAAFTYLLDRGRPPDQKFPGVVDFGVWYVGRALWDVKATRLNLYKAISALASSATGGGTPTAAGSQSAGH